MGIIFGSTGAVLGGKKILEEYRSGKIKISGFQEDSIRENSYALTLSNKIVTIGEFQVIDLANEDDISRILKTVEFSKEGFILRPGNLYLCVMNEKVTSKKYLTHIQAIPAFSEFGLETAAGFGFGVPKIENMFVPIKVVYPMKVYAGMDICEVHFFAKE